MIATINKMIAMVWYATHGGKPECITDESIRPDPELWGHERVGSKAERPPFPRRHRYTPEGLEKRRMERNDRMVQRHLDEQVAKIGGYYVPVDDRQAHESGRRFSVQEAMGLDDAESTDILSSEYDFHTSCEDRPNVSARLPEHRPRHTEQGRQTSTSNPTADAFPTILWDTYSNECPTPGCEVDFSL